MIINGVEIEDTFAEAFRMTATRVLITAINQKWARHAADFSDVQLQPRTLGA